MDQAAKAEHRRDMFSLIMKYEKSNMSARAFYRQHNVPEHIFYYWRKKYGGMEVSHLRRLKEFEDENNKLKQMYADVSLDNKMLKDIMSKKF